MCKTRRFVMFWNVTCICTSRTAWQCLGGWADERAWSHFWAHACAIGYLSVCFVYLYVLLHSPDKMQSHRYTYYNALAFSTYDRAEWLGGWLAGWRLLWFFGIPSRNFPLSLFSEWMNKWMNENVRDQIHIYIFNEIHMTADVSSLPRAIEIGNGGVVAVAVAPCKLWSINYTWCKMLL